jgi:hypothetical protein
MRLSAGFAGLLKISIRDGARVDKFSRLVAAIWAISWLHSYLCLEIAVFGMNLLILPCKCQIEHNTGFFYPLLTHVWTIDLNVT